MGTKKSNTRLRGRLRPRAAPQQQRSQETVSRIFAATSALLARHNDVASITTVMIAKEAGLSIGGLYRFFPDKQAIIDALSIHHVESFRETLEASLRTSQGGRDLLVHIIDAWVDYLDRHPEFAALAHGDGLISAKTLAEHSGADSPGGMLLLKQASNNPSRDSQRLALKLEIASRVGRAVTSYAFEQSNRSKRNSIISELKGLLAAYLADGGDID